VVNFKETLVLYVYTNQRRRYNMMDAAEKFWIGPKNPELQTVYLMASDSTQKAWLECKDGTQLDPDYGEYSVRIHDPSIRSLSFIYKTIAILPKSRLRTIYNLIGKYLAKYDDEEETGYCDKCIHMCTTPMTEPCEGFEAGE
jgi:hypothetical protein